MLDDDWLRSLSDYNEGILRRDDVYRRIVDAFQVRTTDEWVRLSDNYGVWVGPVYDYADLLEDKHIDEVGIFVDQPGRGTSGVRTVRIPIQMSGTPPTIRRGAPSLGEHTAEVLLEIGYQDEEIALLSGSGVVRIVEGSQS
jgi:crotonobetainyl-CoA:carnitine CoA-transferase CaiB-like acyl-CoA transferase